MNSLALSRHSQLLEVLEIPQVMETCVRNGYYEEALDLNAHVHKMNKKHGNIPIIKVHPCHVWSMVGSVGVGGGGDGGTCLCPLWQLSHSTAHHNVQEETLLLHFILSVCCFLPLYQSHQTLGPTELMGKKRKGFGRVVTNIWFV